MDEKQKKNILITGLPGSGKTTLIRKIAAELAEYDPVGFYTQEIRVHGTRQGFELVSFSGLHRILSHVTIKSPHRIGKYGVDTAGFEDFLAALPVRDTRHRLVIIDEIGKMECTSPLFRVMAGEILASDTPSIATIAARGDRFIEGIKQREDATTIFLTEKNRDELTARVVDNVQKILKKKE
jgi:nucleoside-triphosphatase